MNGTRKDIVLSWEIQLLILPQLQEYFLPSTEWRSYQGAHRAQFYRTTRSTRTFRGWFPLLLCKWTLFSLPSTTTQNYPWEGRLDGTRWVLFAQLITTAWLFPKDSSRKLQFTASKSCRTSSTSTALPTCPQKSDN